MTQQTSHYPAAKLRALVVAAEVASRRARVTYLITNRHFRGQAALRAQALCSRLRRAPVPVPPPLLTAHPELRQIAAPSHVGGS
jgi:hypothetical protein